MAQVGQTTPSGGRSKFIFETEGAMRRITLPVAATLNFIGCYCWEQTTVNENDVKGAIYTTAGIKLYETNVLANAITTLPTSPFDAHIPFPGGCTLAAGTYDLVVAGTGRGGVPVVNGQNDATGLPTAMNGTAIYPTFPADYTGFVDSATPRQWDLYLDYTPSAGGLVSNQGLALLGVG